MMRFLNQSQENNVEPKVVNNGLFVEELTMSANDNKWDERDA